MTAVVQLRDFDTPTTAADMHAAAAASRWCLELYRVAPRMHFVAEDGLRCACVFEAPDAEAMRNVLRGTGFSVPRALWSATVHMGSADRNGMFDPPAFEGALTVVERRFVQPLAFDDIQAQEDRAAACLALHRVKFLRSYFSVDRTNMVCLYAAPDAEAVRSANRQTGLPFESVWPATVVVPGRA